MHIMMKTILILWFLLPIPSIAEVNNRNTILELGMGMSNMRNMLEAYILVGIKLKYKNPQKKLSKGMEQYEDMLLRIEKNYQHDKTMQKSIIVSKKAWEPVKNAMLLSLGNVSLVTMKQGAIFIHGNIRTVIKQMALMKNHLLSKSSIQGKEFLNASIEIAASSRRLSAHYMMDLWHLDDPTIQKHWLKGLSIYKSSLITLETSPYMDNPKFASLWRSCRKYYVYFKKMGDKPKIFSILIDKKADIAFKYAREMTEIILKEKN